ncbi:MAG: hypothetical protein WDZ52_16045 [Pseudohongiellaceae bacterium]
MTPTMHSDHSQLRPMPVNIVVAHALEAKALIPMLQLKALQTDSGYSEYANANGLRLIVSDIGKEAVSRAVSSLAHAQSNDAGQISAWLNIGIAGHASAAIGSAWLAHKITDQRSGRSAYPPQLIEGLASCSIITVDEPEQDYALEAVYDMEAAAFYEAASKQATAELVQLFKIVSDNLINPVEEIDLKSVPLWIARQDSQILLLVDKLAELAASYNSRQYVPRVYYDICSLTHLTVNEKLQLRRLCQRYRALGREDELADINLLAKNHTKKLLSILSSAIDQPPALK